MSIFLQRKSIRKYDENYKISRNELEEILKISLRAPTSMNLQPNKVLVIESKEGKEMIRPSLYGNYIQLDTSSAFIVIFTDLNKFDHAENIFKHAHTQGLMPLNILQEQIEKTQNISRFVTKETVLKDGLIDAGLFAMQLMLVAKSFGYDTCPIGGFNKETINQALNIDESLYPALIISLGKADEEGFESARLPLEEVVTYL